MDTTAPEDFDEFLKRRVDASDAYIRGDAAPLAAMLTANDPASFMPPSGAVFVGATTAAEAQIAGAAAFGPRSTGRFEVLDHGSNGDFAYWAGRQVATMDVVGRDEPVEMILRTTEVFRREGGRWKLVHRHADIPAPTS